MKHTLVSALLFVLGSTAAHADNLHSIEHGSNGFEIFRSGLPTRAEFNGICAAGIRRFVVLSGDAAKVELKYASGCPGTQVLYNVRQDATIPLTPEFLKQFDGWVAQARADGAKILFRCDCGCHRTGRLAAYYRMKYDGYTVVQAVAEMNDLGKFMGLYPTLPAQVQALDDYVHGRPCSVSRSLCIAPAGPRQKPLQ